MNSYIVDERAILNRHYHVEAETEAKAIGKVERGEVEPEGEFTEVEKRLEMSVHQVEE